METKDIYRKLEGISDTINTMQVHLAGMEVDLRHHVEGVVQNRIEIKKLQDTQSRWKGALIATGTVIAAVITLVQLYLRYKT